MGWVGLPPPLPPPGACGWGEGSTALTLNQVHLDHVACVAWLALLVQRQAATGHVSLPQPRGRGRGHSLKAPQPGVGIQSQRPRQVSGGHCGSTRGHWHQRRQKPPSPRWTGRRPPAASWPAFLWDPSHLPASCAMQPLSQFSFPITRSLSRPWSRRCHAGPGPSPLPPQESPTAPVTAPSSWQHAAGAPAGAGSSGSRGREPRAGQGRGEGPANPVDAASPTSAPTPCPLLPSSWAQPANLRPWDSVTCHPLCCPQPRGYLQLPCPVWSRILSPRPPQDLRTASGRQGGLSWRGPEPGLVAVQDSVASLPLPGSLPCLLSQCML